MNLKGPKTPLMKFPRFNSNFAQETAVYINTHIIIALFVMQKCSK